MTPHTPHATSKSSDPSYATARKEFPMNPKSSHPTSAHEMFGSDLPHLTCLAGLARQQLSVASENASALFHGSEALRKIQLDTAHEASVRYAKAAKKMLTPCQPAELLAFQTELLRADMQSASQYWQQLTTAMLQTQKEIMTNASHVINNENGGVNSVMEAFQASIPAMTNSFFIPRAVDADEKRQHDA